LPPRPISAPFLVPHDANGMAYALVGYGFAWTATWLYARLKHGRGVRVRPASIDTWNAA
jgi:hypothetical protein